MARRYPVKLLVPVGLLLAFLMIAWPAQRYFASAGSEGAKADPQPSSEPVVKIYPCPPRDLRATTARLEQAFGGTEGVRVVPDERRSQILVFAPPETHARIAQFLGSSSAPRPAAVRAPAAAAPFALPPSAVREDVRLWNSTPEQCEASLIQMFGPRLAPLANSAQGVSAYRLGLADGYAMEIVVHRGESRVSVAGPRLAVNSASQLIHALDNPQLPAERGIRMVSLNAAQAAEVQPAIDAIRAGQDAPPAAGPALPPGPPAPPQPGAPAGPNAPAGQVPPGQQVPRGQQAPPGQTAGAINENAGLIGSVQVEMLDGLDVVILRGHPRDVEKVAQIMQQIEQLSAVTKPSVQVLPLRHVNCVALGGLLEQLYQEVYQPRQGAVSITPLVKPNALLVVGRTENVATVADLVRRLDRPVQPTDQFRVFHLKHAAADTVQTMIDSFLNPAQQGEESGLASRGQVVSDFRTNSLIVQASPRDMAEVEAMIARLDASTNDAVNEVHVFKLRNSLASDLAPILQDAITGQMYGQRSRQAAGTQYGGASQQRTDFERKSVRLRFLTVDSRGHQLLNSGILTDAQVTADPRTNCLVVTASAESMPLIGALIAELDQLPDVEAQIKVFTLVNSDANNMMTMLQGIFGMQQTGGQLGVQSGGQGAGEQPAVRVGTAEGESTLATLRFAVDARTNSIIASGTAGQLTVVEAILLRLDESDVRNRQSTVYRLKNAPATDVAKAINDYLRSERSVQQVAPGLLSAFEQIEREVVVVAEPVSNSLILCATPRFYEEIIGLVQKLDERPPMVMIQVLIAEVTLDSTDEFGVELGLQDGLLFDRSVAGTSSLVGTNVPGFLFNSSGPLGNSNSAQSLATAPLVAGQGITSLNVGRTNGDLGFGGLVLSASSESVNVLIRALKENRRVDVLSRPQVMTMDNQTAEILVGQDVPTITNSQITEAGNQINSITYKEVGLILTVTPRISPDKLVVMEIDATKSDVGSEAEGIPISVAQGQVVRSPRINITSARTVISSADGQTVVLGGLISKSHQHTERKVPVLGDLPLLKNLFRYDFDSQHKAELLIIMTPHIVQSEGDAEKLKKIETARMDWCLGDVLELHDGFGLNSRTSVGPDAQGQVIYPDSPEKNSPPPPVEEKSAVKPIQVPAEPAPAPAVPPPPQTDKNTSPDAGQTPAESASAGPRVLPRTADRSSAASADDKGSRRTEVRILSR